MAPEANQPVSASARTAQLELSAEVFSIPLGDSTYLIYAPLRRAAFVGNVAVVEFISQLQQGSFQPSLDPDGHLATVLRRLEIVDAGPEVRPVTNCYGQPEPVSVTLLLTTACNLRCTYCYASAGSAAPKFMTLDTARRGIDFVIGNALKRQAPESGIDYHGGGEPTLNWRVLVGSLEYARQKAAERGLALRSSLATNGVLSDAQIDWIVANLNGVTLSCDGLPEVHDKCRLALSGQGSSAQVIRTLRRFDEAKFRYGIRLTVTAENIRTLPDSIEFLCANFHGESIQIEPVYLLGRGSSEPSAETDEFIAAFRLAEQRAAAHGCGIQFSAARVDTLTNHFCAVSQDNFCLSADGNVTACYEAFSEDSPWAGKFFYGRPDPGGSGYVFDLEVLDQLRSQAVNERRHCAGCFAKWHCGGDCYYKWIVGSGGGEFCGSARCHVTRELTKDQILSKIEAAGGLFWHEPPQCPAGTKPRNGSG